MSDIFSQPSLIPRQVSLYPVPFWTSQNEALLRRTIIDMAVARAVLRGARFIPFPPTTAASFNPALGCRAYAGQVKSKPGNSKSKGSAVRRVRPIGTDSFYDRDGHIRTTPENKDFLQTTGIAVDNGKTRKLNDVSGVLRKHGVVVAFHPQHLVHPFQIDFLDPRGHPAAGYKRAQLLEQHNTQALWSMAMAMSKGVKAIVRTRAQRRVRSSLYGGLLRAGYDKYGVGKGKRIYGTVWFIMQEPLKYINMAPSEEVGDTIVKILEAEMTEQEMRSTIPRTSHRVVDRERSGPRMQRQSDWEYQEKKAPSLPRQPKVRRERDGGRTKFGDSNDKSQSKKNFEDAFHLKR